MAKKKSDIMKKDGPRLKCRGFTFHYIFGERTFECEVRLKDEIVMIKSGEEVLLVQQVPYNSPIDSRYFFDDWLEKFIESKRNPYGKRG